MGWSPILWLIAATTQGILPLGGVSAASATAESRVVVLDAGHGGTNAGATGAVLGVHEKDLTLAVTRQVADKLTRSGVKVVLTRDSDIYLSLRERAHRANLANGDLYVSIHANATPTRSASGYETYVLSPKALDVDGRALRVADGAARPGLDPETALLIDDLERGSAQWDAADLAARIQANLRTLRGPDGDRGVRQESMHAILGATMPAVLVEIGFIDHPIEGKELLEPTTQDAIADAIARGILDELNDE